MNIQENQTIGELVAKDYRTATVFKKHKIDFCCQGNRTISDACETQKINKEIVLSELNTIVQSLSDNTTNYESWPLNLLAEYIEKKHHHYVEEKTQEIIPYLDKICKVHGKRHPELFEIREHFYKTAAELAKHMKKEELILFPFISKMALAKQENAKWNTPYFGTVQNPIQVMMDEHSTEGERFRKIEKLSNNYTTPEDACNTYKVAIALLKEFEQDLHLHIHLENNILFPKAIELEKELTQKN